MFLAVTISEIISLLKCKAKRKGLVTVRKPFYWLLLALLLVVAVITFAFFIDEVNVTASNIAMTEQGWEAKFSTPLKETSAASKYLYITNRDGRRVKADFTVGEAGKTLHVAGLEPGSYTLHVKKRAVAGKSFKVLPVDKIKFTVHETLESVASAKELEAYFKNAKRHQNKMLFALEESSESSSEDKDMSAKGDTSGSSDYSTTNNQVEGIDEGDSVKTDGEYIYSLVGDGKLSITDIRDSSKMKNVATIPMEEGFYPSQLFLHEKTLIVLGSAYEDLPVTTENSSSKKMMPGISLTTVRLYDVSKPEKPTLVREVGAEGYLSGARKSGNILYFVSSLQPNYWIMEDLQGDLLRPRVRDSIKTADSTMLDYKEISILPGAMEPTYSVITAIDLESPKNSKLITKGYLGASEQLYMSKENLYLTATIYEEEKKSNSKSDTSFWNMATANSELFKFTLQGTAVGFHSSASLKGTVLNQFSMDEHDGYFRLVTTEGNRWDEKATTINHLFILDEGMKQVGSVEGLAPGERIYSARFMGDKAYMVTFKETDPLFVIDVATPTAPKVLGELKIPGFSNYLHPLDENHLIGFGYDTVVQKNPNGGEPIVLTQGMKVSLFDVTDFANPKEKDTEIIGGRGTYSPIQYDHKALFQHGKRNLYGFPVMIYRERAVKKEFEDLRYDGDGALIYEITPEKGIVLKGDLIEKSKGEQYGDYENEIQRLIYSKDSIYTISMKNITQYSLDTFKKTGNLKR